MAGTLWLLANKADLSLKVALVDLSIPISFVNFAVACLLLSTILHVLSYFILNEFVRVASNRLFKFDSPWALTAIFDGGGVWSNTAITQWRFFASSTAHSRIGKMTVLIVNLPILAILFVSFLTVVLVGWRVITHEGLLSLGGMFTIIAWLLLLSSVAQILVMLIPFTFEKNKRFVRWMFLYKMHRRYGLFPKLVNVWLQDQELEKAQTKSGR
jgi:hypothetical protein